MRRRFILLGICLLLMGYGWLRIHMALRWQLPTAWIAHSLSVTGKVISEPSLQQGLMRFKLRTSTINRNLIHQTIQLSWFGPKSRVAMGERCYGEVSVKPVHALRNPQTLPSRLWLRSFQYRAQGYIKHDRWHCEMTSLNLRHRLVNQIKRSIKQHSLAAFITALTVGIQTKLLSADWQVLQHTGTSHLVAISGLHLGLVAWLSYQLMNGLWRLSARLCLRIPSPKVAAVAAIIAMLLYAALSGFAIPTQRALVMNSVVMLTLLLAINWPLSWRLLLAALVVLIWQPWDILSASFWLSFAAVSWIAYIMLHLESLSSWRAWLRLQALMSLGLLPLTLYFFHGVSIAALAANLVAIPWVSFILVPCTLLASAMAAMHLPWSVMIFKLSGWLLWPLWFFLQTLANMPYGYIAYWLPNGLTAFVLVLFVLWLCAPRGVPYRWLAVIGVVAIFSYRQPQPKAGEVWGTMLDVGQGLAMVIRTAHHVLIFDTGPRYPTGFDAGQMVVLPYLHFLHVKHIDRIMISHGDNDHIGGLKALLQSMPVADVLTSVPTKQVKIHAKVPIQFCYAGQHWRWDQVDFDVLYPPKGLPYHANNSSCVLRISAKDRHILLTGDIEKPAEQWLLLHAKNQLPAEILQVPHHGSRTSSTMAFLKAVHPQLALISSGFYNRFHFPHSSVISRYKQLGVKMFNTAKSGYFRVTSNKHIICLPIKFLKKGVSRCADLHH
ncbi:MAG: DNA internalization-related competence protein ComEC/Rec2 [Coxiellaceae bacterium]|nr:DNA internalization-related competence protein ComEC/Rec2 [Coxiellaceae bacterium]